MRPLDEQPGLPTVEQAQEFLRVVNRGRTAMGLEPLEVLDFDGAKPDRPDGCLSATNVFVAAGYRVWATEVHSTCEYDVVPRPEVLRAMGMERNLVPEAITVVTDPFDKKVPGLRERLVEAGVVAP